MESATTRQRCPWFSLLGEIRLKPFPEGRSEGAGTAEIPVGYGYNLVEFQALDPGGIVQCLGGDLPGSFSALELDYHEVAAHLDAEKVDYAPEPGPHLPADDHEGGVNDRYVAGQPVLKPLLKPGLPCLNLGECPFRGDLP